jgi:hypothetical protein
MPREAAENQAYRTCSLAWQLFLLSFAALFLELMVIRWVPSTLRFVAYYANLMLISSFLGLGIGALVSDRKWSLFRWFPLLLAGHIGLVLIWQQLMPAIAMPGSQAEVRFYLNEHRAVSYVALVAVFVLNTAVFVPLGERIGQLFREMPPLTAYAWDLTGSLAGTLGFGVFSLGFFSPALGLAAVMLIYLVLLAGIWPRVAAAACFAVVLAAVIWSGERAAIWSPYHYITVQIENAPPGAPPVSEPVADLRTMRDPPLYSVSVNQDFYQQHGTLDLARYTPGSPRAKEVENMLRSAYLLPYQVARRPKRVLVVGAGGGLDVEAALLAGAEHVDAVEIDEELVKLSRRFSAAGVYDIPRVTVHIDDARAFFRRTPHKYDLVVFGFLDSQALFSHASNIRLDGYIYTVESMRAAYALLTEGGLVSVSFVTPQPWLRSKLVRMLAQGTGAEPIVYAAGMQTILLAPRGDVGMPPQSFGRFALAEVPDLGHPVATDDWPFLYLMERTIPSDYLLAIATLVVVSLVPILYIRGIAVSREDGHFFFLGLGFLLLETKSITDCSLFFGTTWLVTMIVLAGVLVMVLAANLAAARIRAFSPRLYAPLFAAVLVLYFVPTDWVLALPHAGRLAYALVAVPLPIFFAGLIFSTTFRAAQNSSAALGANLIGATAGGFLEYFSMTTGTRALTLVVLAAYGLSFLLATRQSAEPRRRRGKAAT